MYKPHMLQKEKALLQLLFYTYCDQLTKNRLKALEKDMIMMCRGTLYLHENVEYYQKCSALSHIIRMAYNCSEDT